DRYRGAEEPPGIPFGEAAFGGHAVGAIAGIRPLFAPFVGEPWLLQKYLPPLSPLGRAGHGRVHLDRTDPRRTTTEAADLHPRVERHSGPGQQTHGPPHL